MGGPQKTINSTLRRCLICFNSNRISSSDIYYFQLPSDPVIAAQWFRNLNRNELVKHLLQKNYSNSVWICSEHFPSSAVFINPMNASPTLVPGTFPLIVKPDVKKKPPAILAPADRNLLFCRQRPVETELSYFRLQFDKFQHFQQYRIHCTTCDAHINLTPLNKDQIRVHNFLKVIQCVECYHFDGKTGPLPVNKDLTIQCQCGVANSLVKCYCGAIFCKVCNWKNVESMQTPSKCLWCTPSVTLDLRALQWAVFKVLDFKYKSITTNVKYKDYTTERIKKLLEKDLAGCCGNVSVPSVPNKPLAIVESAAEISLFQKPPNIRIIKQRRPPETTTNNSIAIKKIILSNPVGKPTEMDTVPLIATVNSVQNVDIVPPLTPITKVVVTEKVPIIANVTSIAGNGVVPVLEESQLKLLTPVKNYFKFNKPLQTIAPKQSTSGSTVMVPAQVKKCRPERIILDDRCLEIKTNFKNNGTFLKTLCNHFMFKVENMQRGETSKSSVVNLHQQLISAIGDICDKLESVKEKCMQDLQKCSEAQVTNVPAPTIEPSKGNNYVVTASNNAPPVINTNDERRMDSNVEPSMVLASDKEMVVSIPVVVPNDEEDDEEDDEEEEVYELYDIIDTDFPECDVLIKESDIDCGMEET